MATPPSQAVPIRVGRADGHASVVGTPGGPTPYLLRVDDDPSVPFTLPWDAAFTAALEPAEQASEQGRNGWRALFAELLGAALPSLWRRLEEAGDAPVRIDLSLDADELFHLPWELLPASRGGPSLCQIAQVGIAWSAAGSPVADREPGLATRLLVAWAEPDLPVRPQRHVDAITRAARARGFDFDPARDVVEDASVQALQRALQRSPPATLLHVLAHGLMMGEGAGRSQALALRAEGGGVDRVSPEDLVTALEPYAGSLRAVVLMACGADQAGRTVQAQSVARAIHRAGVAQVVACRAPLSVARAEELTEQLYRGLLVSCLPPLQALSRAAFAVGPLEPDIRCVRLYAAPDAVEERPLSLNPFVGARPYEATDASLFFGRREAVAELTRNLASGRGIHLLVGPRGCGKTSLARAGLAAELRDRLVWAPKPSSVGPGEILAMDDLGGLLGDAADAHANLARLEPLARHNAVLVLARPDQLARARAGGFLTAPAGGGDPPGPTEVVLAPVTPTACSDLVQEAALAVGVSLDRELLSTIAEGCAGARAPLPILSRTLGLLWRSGRGVTLEEWRATGGLVGRLAQEAEAWHAAASAEQRDQLPRVFVELAEARQGGFGGRRLGTAADLPQKLVASLVAAGLLVEGEQGAELAHDDLLDRWAYARDWLAERRAPLAEVGRLRPRVEAWCREGGELPGSKELARARGLLEPLFAALPPAFVAYLDAGERRAARWRRTGGLAVAGVLGSVAVVTALAVRAGESDARAERETWEATLARARMETAGGNVDAAARTAVRAVAGMPRRTVRPEDQLRAAAVLLEALTGGLPHRAVPLSGPLPQTVALPGDLPREATALASGPGDQLLVGMDDGEVVILDVTTGITTPVGGAVGAPVVTLVAAGEGGQGTVAWSTGTTIRIAPWRTVGAEYQFGASRVVEARMPVVGLAPLAGGFLFRAAAGLCSAWTEVAEGPWEPCRAPPDDGGVRVRGDAFMMGEREIRAPGLRAVAKAGSETCAAGTWKGLRCWSIKGPFERSPPGGGSVTGVAPGGLLVRREEGPEDSHATDLLLLPSGRVVATEEGYVFWLDAEGNVRGRAHLGGLPIDLARAWGDAVAVLVRPTRGARALSSVVRATPDGVTQVLVGSEGATCVSGDPTGSTVAWGTPDGMAHLWGAHDRRSFEAHDEPVRALEFSSPDVLVTVGREGELRWWKLHEATQELYATGGGPFDPVAGGAFDLAAFGGDPANPADDLVAIGDQHGAVHLYAAAWPTSLGSFPLHAASGVNLAFDADGRALWTGGPEGAAYQLPLGDLDGLVALACGALGSGVDGCPRGPTGDGPR